MKIAKKLVNFLTQKLNSMEFIAQTEQNVNIKSIEKLKMIEKLQLLENLLETFLLKMGKPENWKLLNLEKN